jgi:hypothetical protein
MPKSMKRKQGGKGTAGEGVGGQQVKKAKPKPKPKENIIEREETDDKTETETDDETDDEDDACSRGMLIRNDTDSDAKEADSEEDDSDSDAKEAGSEEEDADAFNSLTIKQLKQKCKLKGVKRTGSKAELVAALLHNASWDLTWSKPDTLVPKQLPEFNRQCGPAHLHVDKPRGRPRTLTALDFFLMLITLDMFAMFVEETNRYAQQCRSVDSTLDPPLDLEGNECAGDSAQMSAHTKRKDGDGNAFETNVEEMMAFFGLMIFMGYHKLPSFHCYWSEQPQMGVDWVKDRFARERVEEIRRYFHVSDNLKSHVSSKTGRPCTNTMCKDIEHDKLHKLRPFLLLLAPALMAAWCMRQRNAIDEVIAGFKGQTRMKAYIPTKKHQWGIKIWKACDSLSGYMWAFLIYTGANGNGSAHDPYKNLPQDNGVSWTVGEKVVLYFAMMMGAGTPWIIFLDNYFTTVRLLLT